MMVTANKPLTSSLLHFKDSFMLSSSLKETTRKKKLIYHYHDKHAHTLFLYCELLCEHYSCCIYSALIGTKWTHSQTVCAHCE